MPKILRYLIMSKLLLSNARYLASFRRLDDYWLEILILPVIFKIFNYRQSGRTSAERLNIFLALHLILALTPQRNGLVGTKKNELAKLHINYESRAIIWYKIPIFDEKKQAHLEKTHIWVILCYKIDHFCPLKSNFHPFSVI